MTDFSNLFFKAEVRIIIGAVKGKYVKKSRFLSRSQKLSKLNGKNAQKGGEEIVGIEKVTKVQEICKKVLTKRGGSGRIIKLSRERQRKKNVAVKGCRKELEKNLKNFSKTY